jgi:hypothetical protein
LSYVVKPEWLQALRALDDKADLRFNYLLHRWEFILTCADGTPRSQFWCRFDAMRDEVYEDPITGKRVSQRVPDRDSVNGLMPFRELTDAEFAVALKNLTESFVGNPHDGAGTVRRQVMRNYRFNRDLKERKFREAGTDMADFLWEHRRQIRDAGAGPVSGWTRAREAKRPPKAKAKKEQNVIVVRA